MDSIFDNKTTRKKRKVPRFVIIIMNVYLLQRRIEFLRNMSCYIYMVNRKIII